MRKILVRLTGEGSDTATLDAARSLAKRFGTRLDGVFVRPRPSSILLEASPQDALGSLLGAQPISDLDAEDDDRERSARSLFRGDYADVAGAWRQLVGRSSLALEAALADILVETRAWSDPDDGSDSLFHILRDSQAPVLLPAPEGDFNLDLAVVAWGGDLSSARALAAALPILDEAGQVVVLHDRADKSEGLGPLREAIAHLPARLEALDMSGRDAADVLLERAAALNAGLVVTGTHGHGHLQETLFGGFTLRVLSQPRSAVLLRY